MDGGWGCEWVIVHHTIYVRTHKRRVGGEWIDRIYIVYVYKIHKRRTHPKARAPSMDSPVSQSRK